MEQRDLHERSGLEGGHDSASRAAQLVAQVERLSRALQRAETASQRAAGVVHDVRNALHVVLGHAELLSRGPLDPEQDSSVQAIRLAGQQAESVLRGLLTIAREREPRRSWVSGAEVLANCQRLIERMVDRAIECEFVADPDLWPVEVEPHQLESALVNLALNARDAMPDGGRLTVSARNLGAAPRERSTLPPGEYASFAVQDTGVGMGPHVLSRATEAFFTTKSGHGGTGLGLSMVQAFAQGSGGALRLESSPGQGTRAEILLPRARRPAVTRAEGADPGHDTIRRIQGRARTAWMQEALALWRDSCGGDPLPRPAPIEAALAAHADRSLVFAVEPGEGGGALRLLRMGDELVRALELAALGDSGLSDSSLPAGLEAAYRSALRSRQPVYEHARFSFGGASPASLERLVLPAASDGRTVSHLIGLVLLTTQEEAGRDGGDSEQEDPAHATHG